MLAHLKMKNSRYRYLYGTGTHYKSLKFLNFGNENQFWYKKFPIPVPSFFSVPNFADTGSETFFRYQIFPIPVPILFSGTKFFRYRFRYFFPVPIFSDTGSGTTKKIKNSRYREFPVPVCHTLPSMPRHSLSGCYWVKAESSIGALMDSGLPYDREKD